MRKRIDEIRRTELIEAAHRIFLREGLQGLTTARICREAGMSPGILAYYFKGKDEVLYAMVRFNNRLLMEDVVARMRRAKTSWDRLEAIVEGNFPDHSFTRDVAVAWLSVCAATNVNPNYERLQRLFYSRLVSNLASAFGGLLDRDRLRQASVSVAAVIDGLWLRKAVGHDVTRAEAIAVVLRNLASLLSAEEAAALRRMRARSHGAAR
ncbi:MAG: transcriptional regulator BetI [Parvibaculaceae bacterium]|jgi:transcriptional repressor BetI